MQPTNPPTVPQSEPFYPESDGQPMAESTLQLDWILKIVGNLKYLVLGRADVFAAGNQFWYPVRRKPEIVQAPDAYVVFGRPKGVRGSWKQWEENDTAMTVVFEVLSPSNTIPEMAEKLDWYDRYGVEEYYVYDPEKDHLTVYRRGAITLVGVMPVDGYVSPRLGIRFDCSGEEMVIYYPDGSPFRPTEEILTRLADVQQERDVLEHRIEETQEQADELREFLSEANRRAEDARHQAEEARRQTEEASRRAGEAEREREKAEREREKAERLREEADRQREEADRQREEADRLREKAEREREEADRLRDEAEKRADDARERTEKTRQFAQQTQQQLDEARRRVDLVQRRTTRIVELTQKLLVAQASTEEQEELRTLMSVQP